MHRYVAFLRAINVGGRVVRMEQLRRVFEAEGFAGVQTVIASGNVLFESRSRTPAALEKRIETALRAALGFEVTTFLRSGTDLAVIVSQNPFAKAAAAAPGASIYIAFTRALLDPAVVTKVRALGTGTDEFDVRGKEIYWLRRVRSMETLRLMSALDRTVRVPTTVRNITTATKIAGMLER